MRGRRRRRTATARIDHKRLQEQGSILVVDDEPSVLLTIQAILMQEGYSVDGAPDGASAIERLHQKTYDLVLTDLRLGEIDGLDVLAEIQRMSSRTVAIVLTGYASLESAIQAMREGAYDYLVKPTDVEELKMRVAHVFERHRLTDELARRVRELERANATIDRMNANLRLDIDLATVQLRDRVTDLNETKEALERAQAQRETFTAMVAHEMRAPLTPIKLAAQTMERLEMPPDQVKKLAHTVEDRVNYLERLVQDLLDVSRIDTGNFSIQPECCNLSALVRQVVENYRQAHEDRIFEVRLSNEHITGEYDEGRISQALNNLIENAIKYSYPDTTITITLDVTPDNEATLSVADQGMGIPDDQLAAIMEPFMRLNPNENIKGFGLGLYITRGIAQAHGGHLEVSSGKTRARGAVFTLILPGAKIAIE
jgi:signal transduction histidine kinase